MRRVLRTLLAAALLLVAALWEFHDRSPNAAGLHPLCPRCNVLLISLDTLRADHVGAYGYGRPSTPNIDRLAAGSVLFEDAISQSAWTRPAHASMFTGLYPAEHGIIAMAGNRELPGELPTLASVLRGQGYATAAFTGGGNMARQFGFDHGFDLYRSPGRRIKDSLASIESWLDLHREGPFFLFVHGLDPHRPYRSRLRDRQALGLARKPAHGLQYACQAGSGPEVMAPYLGDYDAAIHRGDRAIGRLLAMLKDKKLARPTVVVFTSDHGEEFLDHGRCFHIHTLYREILRVPLMISVPGLEPGRVRGVVPASVAVAPTILAVLGVGENGIRGPSVLSQLLGRPPAFDYVVSETSSRYRAGKGYGHVRALTGDREKLVDWISEGRHEYFDLVRDPFERHASSDSARERLLATRLGRWAKAHPRVAPTRVAGPLPAGLKRELRSLGYLD